MTSNQFNVATSSKEVRRSLEIERTKTRQRVVERLSREEERRLIQAAHRDNSEHRLLIKTLFQTGALVSEFINLRVRDLFFDETIILIHKAKGGRSPLCAHLARLGAGTAHTSGRPQSRLPVCEQPQPALLGPPRPADRQGKSGESEDQEAR